jgi:hypothetical protein
MAIRKLSQGFSMQVNSSSVLIWKRLFPYYDDSSLLYIKALGVFRATATSSIQIVPTAVVQ